jgi:dTMP kinase
MRKGLFITFEGIDGCGKSTQVIRAKRALEKNGVPCIVTREPGGTAIGERIRRLLLSPRNGEICDECELLLYCAARAQHVAEIIVPAMERGEVVLCDRYADATFAYQGFGRGLPTKALENINAFATSGASPALTFLFDISVATSLKRLKQTGKAIDRLEAGGKEFYEKVRQGYLSLARQYPRRVLVTPGESSIEEVSDMVCARIMKLVDRQKLSV